MLSIELEQKSHYAAVHDRLWGKPKRQQRESARSKMARLIAKAEADVAAQYVPKVNYKVPPSAFVPQWKKILQEVCNKHQVSMTEILSHRRDRRIVAARHEAFYRFKMETTMSFPDMGRRMNRDHSTALHGIRKHEQRMREGTAV